MKNLFHRQKNLMVFIFDFLFLIIIISAQVKNESGRTILGSVIFHVLTPIQVLSYNMINGIKAKWEAYINLTDIHKENLQLKEQIKSYQFKLLEYEEIKLNNERLKKLFDLKKKLQFSAIFAEVVAYDSSNFSHTITINKGSSYGLEVDFPVISAHGVVGKIVKIAPWSAQVQLIIDGNSALAAMDQRSRVRGVVAGLGEQYCNLKYIDVLHDVSPNDFIITSGEDGIFPKGLIIGKVVVVRQKDPLFQQIRLIPTVNFQRLEEVAILLKKEEFQPIGRNK